MTIIPNSTEHKNKFVDTVKRPVVIAIIVLSVLLVASVAINIYLIRSSESDSADIVKMREREAVLFRENTRLESVNEAIQAEKDIRTAELDSLKNIINEYDTKKSERKGATNGAVKKSNNLGASESLDNFLQWTDTK